ncbi:META domain-containing protein [Arthrobacter sp. B2a2-09]|uniref:META domain-containing protein n=1 Tax=Arthrobacter sp. B2a2-09 TaxID=2952822 RepID=UPI0022CDA8C4|nr:META domain-containing protein [Arthrobacter sp. B2a2-09]MCZ9880401.1 META domain-containing protein [Arthrobacter sp. B2a2-09]
MTSCASNQAREPGTAIPTPPRTGPASLVTTSAPPREMCAAFLTSAPCSTYVSIAGAADGVDLPWAASGGLTVKLSTLDGSLHVSAKTPCSPVSGPATITGNTLVVGGIAIGAMGCARDAASQEQWFVDFLKRPIEMSFSQGTLNWKSGSDTLIFKGKSGSQ